LELAAAWTCEAVDRDGREGCSNPNTVHLTILIRLGELDATGAQIERGKDRGKVAESFKANPTPLPGAFQSCARSL